MRTALVILLVCAAIDLILCAGLILIVWSQYRTMRREAAAIGEPIPSAAGQFGCLIALGLTGFFVLYGIAWRLLRE